LIDMIRSGLLRSRQRRENIGFDRGRQRSMGSRRVSTHHCQYHAKRPYFSADPK
jgi:hypothetical protein